MTFGLNQDELNLLHKLVVSPLKDRGCAVWIFGSRARGDHQPFSDIDILFECPQNSKLPAALLSQIKESIEESRLNYKVDLVSTEDLAKSYIDNVNRDRVAL